MLLKYGVFVPTHHACMYRSCLFVESRGSRIRSCKMHAIPQHRPASGYHPTLLSVERLELMHLAICGWDYDMPFLRGCGCFVYDLLHCLFGRAGSGLFGGGPGQGGYFEPEGIVIVVCRNVSWLCLDCVEVVLRCMILLLFWLESVGEMVVTQADIR